jgi:1-acyl-sn-glycerol-3-phosphate acyltransferase
VSPTWRSEEEPRLPPLTPASWALAILRGSTLALILLPCLAFLMIARAVEKAFCAPRHPVSPRIVQVYCRAALAVLGLTCERRGQAAPAPSALVANHASWLDILVINAALPVTFVSKAEVAGWPGIGGLARATGTLFIRRASREAAAQRDLLADRLRAGERLVFFPEGTSTDGLRVLPFRSTLFEAFFMQGLPPGLTVQPLAVRYSAPPGAEPRFYGWWGDMDFGSHALQVLGRWRQGRVRLVLQPPLALADHAGRKPLARAAEASVRAGFEA